MAEMTRGIPYPAVSTYIGCPLEHIKPPKNDVNEVKRR
jgi:hypothetical protein